MKTICVFCGSSHGKKAVFTEKAQELGTALAARKIRLVYGGGAVGLMGVVADAALEAGGEVVGVLPKSLAIKEVAHEGLTDMHIVDGMLERKSLMAQLSDAFVAMPGAFGTLDELFEMLTWTQLGYHAKPCAILDVDGYYQKLFHFLDEMVEQQFLKPLHREMMLVDTDVNALLDRLSDYRLPQVTKWIKHENR